MDIVWAIVLVLFNLTCCGITLIGLPGNWIAIAGTGIYALLVSDSRLDLGWVPMVSMLVLAVLGEIIEFVASAAGVSKAGGSRRGAVMALAGSIAGGLLGLAVGLPIPVVGPVLGPLLFAGLGAFGGAVLGERWKGREFEDSVRIGQAAFWGRILGTFGKLIVAVLMVAVVVVSLFV